MKGINPEELPKEAAVQLTDLVGTDLPNIALTAAEQQLLAEIRRPNPDRFGQRPKSDGLPPMRELTADDLVVDVNDSNGFVDLVDDWTLPYAEAGSLSERYRKWFHAEFVYPIDTPSGTVWYGAMERSGFGPTEPRPWTQTHPACVWSPLVTHVPAVDPAELRSEAGFTVDGRVEHRSAMLGHYVDHVDAASFHEAAEDDFWLEGGVWDDESWERFVMDELAL